MPKHLEAVLSRHMELKGEETKIECYPQLRVLTVLHSNRNKSASVEEKEEQNAALRLILSRRARSGFRTLERVEIGWRWEQVGYHHLLGDRSEESCVTGWKDCLKDWSVESGIEGIES